MTKEINEFLPTPFIALKNTFLSGSSTNSEFYIINIGNYSAVICINISPPGGGPPIGPPGPPYIITLFFIVYNLLLFLKLLSNIIIF